MVSQKISLIILTLLCGLMLVACGLPVPPPPPDQAPADSPEAAQGEAQTQTDLSLQEQPVVVEQPANTPTAAGEASSTQGSSEPVNQAEQAEAVVPAAPSNQAPQPAQTAQTTSSVRYPLIDTGQGTCYDDQGSITCPQAGASYYGQDAQYSGLQPSYVNNGDGTITDNLTGLMWQQSPDLNGDGRIDVNDKLTFEAALDGAESFNLAGYDDWRLPTIKELYSLMNFQGVTGSVPYIDTDYFEFAYGDTSAGERDIDAQFASSTLYVSDVMNGAQAMFGLNLADGRIKGYGLGQNPQNPAGKLFYVLYVRGESGYGLNDFVDNGDGTISDRATGLTWMQADSGVGLDWASALNYCESLEYAGQNDWRLPDAKELHSIVDYSRSPDTTDSAAIDPLFQTTWLPNGVNNSGQANYAHYWSSTTHLDGRVPGSRAVYVAFGEARGVMEFRGSQQLLDVHGAGAQRSDQKSGDPDALPVGFGPQGDVQSIENYVRCVRGGAVSLTPEGDPTAERTGQTGQLLGSRPEPPNGATGHPPPPAAIDACTSQSQGATCQVTTPHGQLSGTCELIQQQLACLPEGGPPGQPPGRTTAN